MFSPQARIAPSEHVVLAYADSEYASHCARYFRRQGWKVHLAGSAAEVRRLVRSLSRGVLVLDTGLEDESGWLTCAKLIAEHQAMRVILVAPRSNGESRALADFVGASALVSREDGPQALVSEVLGGTVTAV
jgi:DNA-binding response OmpR family regulator